MSILGSAVGGAFGVGATIFGGIKASEAMRKVKRNIENQKRENRNWYDRRYNEDATQRADAQRILTLTEDAIRNRNRGAAGAQAVMGGTEEAAAAAKAANNQALADAASQIAVNAEARKDSIEQTYQQKDAMLDNALNNIEAQRAGAISQAVLGAGKAAANMSKAF